MAIRDDAGTRALRLAALKGIHRVVLAGLVVIIVSGVLLFGADVDTFLYSKVFWLKMGLMLLLMANGAVLVRAERRVERGDQMRVDAAQVHGDRQPGTVVPDHARRRRSAEYRIAI